MSCTIKLNPSPINNSSCLILSFYHTVSALSNFMKHPCNLYQSYKPKHWSDGPTEIISHQMCRYKGLEVDYICLGIEKSTFRLRDNASDTAGGLRADAVSIRQLQFSDRAMRSTWSHPQLSWYFRCVSSYRHESAAGLTGVRAWSNVGCGISVLRWSVMGWVNSYFLANLKHLESDLRKNTISNWECIDGRFDAEYVNPCRMISFLGLQTRGFGSAWPSWRGLFTKVKRMQAWGMRCTYNVQPSHMVGASCLANDLTALVVAAIPRATIFERFGKNLGLAVETILSMPQVQDRRNGLPVRIHCLLIPTATVAFRGDGRAVIRSANAGGARYVAGAFDINVILVSTTTVRLCVAALRRNRQLYLPIGVVVSSRDGSEPVMLNLGSNDSPLKAESGWSSVWFSGIATFKSPRCYFIWRCWTKTLQV